MTGGRATSQDVADLAGVSRSAVSLVLNGRADGMISAKKQDAIRAAARQLNYVPNSVALSLRTRRTSTIGVLADTPDTSSAIADTLLGAGVEAVQAGYLLLIIGLAAADGDEERAWQILQTRQVDGLVFVAGALCQRPSPELLRGRPAVLANCVDTDAVVPGLVSDEAAAITLLVRHLRQHGHRDIALITPPEWTAGCAARLRGFDWALADLGGPSRPALPVGSGICDGHAAGMRLLDVGPDRPRPTAIIASDENSAIGVALAAAQLGLSIPEDLSMVTVEQEQKALAAMAPPLTVVRQPYVQIGMAAVREVLEAIKSDATREPVQRQVVGELIVRRSVAAPALVSR